MKGEVRYGSTEDLVFEEAVEFLNTKTPLPSEIYEALADACKAKAFSVAGIQALNFCGSF